MKAKENTQLPPQTPEPHRSPFCSVPVPGGAGAKPQGMAQGFAAILEEDLAPLLASTRGGPWIIGFSHGADSTALLLLLHEFSRSRDCPVLHPIHVDHGLRPESAVEALQALDFCERLGLPCEIHRIQAGRGESQARQARYGIFKARAKELGASLLILAHHRDDDLETLLFRFLRGTGPLGLAGIPVRRPLDPASGLRTEVYRPLLGYAKQELLDWIAEQGQSWIEDPSNALSGHTARNRIRHELIPRILAQPDAWTQLCKLSQEAKRFSARVHEEIRDLPLGPRPLLPEAFRPPEASQPPETSGPPRASETVTLPLQLLQALSPWAFERYFSLLLESLGQARPTRAHLHQAHLLLVPALPSGKCVEARGRWRVERRKKELHLRLLAP